MEAVAILLYDLRHNFQVFLFFDIYFDEKALF
jgi:hypothetical protein